MRCSTIVGMLDLSKDQNKALKDLVMWYKNIRRMKTSDLLSQYIQDRHRMQYVTLGGYAGTGKTTLIALLREELFRVDPDVSVGFVSYTGKATRVLKNSLTGLKTLRKNDSVSTIHSLIYSPLVNTRQEIIGWKPKEKIESNLIIVDEASMVDEQIWKQLLSYQVPIIAVGDHGQLPPINSSFNLMKKPDLILTRIHRQAKQNPIIDISIQARENGSIRARGYQDTVVKYSVTEPETHSIMQEKFQEYSPDTLILCGFNSTRKKINSFIRNAQGMENPEPVIGDRVICLRNNHKKRIFNGMLGTIREIRKKDASWYKAEIALDEEQETYEGLISVKQFNNEASLNFTGNRADTMAGDLFDFGYALTVHKAQGSQAKKVILLEERFPKMTDEDWRRWLYTAVTRASEELYIFGQ